MDPIFGIIQKYLTTENNQAILLNGKWGTGKTHFLKNFIFPEIIEKKVKNIDGKIYNPIIVSLFGLNSIIDVQTQILLQSHLILKSEPVKVTGKIASTLVQAFTKLNPESIQKFYNDLISISFDELFVCFDDLERRSEKLPLDELIGFVNELVENKSAKVLIIANEDKIKAENYSVLKEKVICNSIEFIQNNEEIYKAIINNFTSKNALYLDFLEKSKDIVNKYFFLHSRNLRILKYSISYFEQIFDEFSIFIKTDHKLNVDKNQIINSLLKFTISTCIDFKEGRISKNNSEELLEKNSINYDFLFDKNEGDNETIETHVGIKFRNTYYQNEKYEFYTSIFSYLVGSNIFDFDSLKLELEKKFIIENKSLSKKEIIYEKLRYPNCLNLSDKDYKYYTNSMLTMAKLGEFENLSEYFDTFECVIRYNNPLKIKLQILESNILLGLKRAKNNLKLASELSYYNRDNNSFMSEDISLSYKRIYQQIEVINENLKINHKKKEIIALETLCYESFNVFLDEIYDNKSQFKFNPFLHLFNYNKFYNFINNTTNENRILLATFFKNRYNNNLIKELVFEKLFLEKLHKRILNNPNLKKNVNVSGQVYKMLEETVNFGISRMN